MEEDGQIQQSRSYFWFLSKPLGQGATSKVYKGRHKDTGEEVAIKVFTSTSYSRPVEVQHREFQVMLKLDHKNIVKMRDIEETKQGNKIIVMELATCGSLFNMLEDPCNSFGLEEDEFLLVLNHVAGGMEYLHSNGIVHRDVKPGNILCYLEPDGRHMYKLTDFGAARELEHEEEKFTSLYGTEEYLHPDVYGRAVMRDRGIGPFDSTVDLWSLGVTIYQTATGQLPFRPYGGRKNRMTMYEIVTKKKSGYISGIQKSDNGPIEWSRELPSVCRLSSGLKSMITPILAGLLEMGQRKWTFQKCFKELDFLLSQKVIHAFCPDTWSNLRVYICEDSKLAKLQDLIAAQSELLIEDQMLFHRGKPLKVDNMAPISQYPQAVFSSIHPIFVLNKACCEGKEFPVLTKFEFPNFSLGCSVAADYQIAKSCNNIVHRIWKDVKLYHHNVTKIQECVALYKHSLQHDFETMERDFTNLQAHFNTAMTLFANYKLTISQSICLFDNMCKNFENRFVNNQFTHSQKNIPVDARLQQLTDFAEKLQRHMVSKKAKIEDLSRRINCELEGCWKDADGCVSERDRCAERVEVIMSMVKKTAAAFRVDRERLQPSKSSEKVHFFVKHKLQEHCSTVQSLVETCETRAKEQFNQYNKFSRFVISIRKSLLKTRDSIDQLSTQLSIFNADFDKACKAIMEDIDCLVRKWTENRPVEPQGASIGSCPNNNDLIRNVLQGNLQQLRCLDSAIHENQSALQINSSSLNSMMDPGENV